MFLFNDILVYGSIVIKNKKYTRQHIIPLENVKIEDCEDDGECAVNSSPSFFILIFFLDPPYGWSIRTPIKSFMVYAASQNEKSEWINHINMCIKELLDKSN